MNDVSVRQQGASWASTRVVLCPGDLLVSREGPVILVADARTPGQEATVDRLQNLCADAARTVAEETPEALVRSVAGLLATCRPDDVPALGFVTVDENRLLVTLTHGMRMAVTTADGAIESVDAERSLLPVSRIVPGDVVQVVIGPHPSLLQEDRRSHLSGGVVRAGGLFLEPGHSAARTGLREETLVGLAPLPAPPVVADIDRAPSFTTFSLHGDIDEIKDRGAAEDTAASSDPEPDTGPLVRGIVCSRGHFNPPDARFCERCGISMVHQTHNLVTGHRPPLGVLVVDDGRVHVLVRDYVIGRDPGSADEVMTGRAGPLPLEDPELSLSRVHARLVLDGWDVRVEDAGSVNGTFVSDAGSEDWRRLEAEIPTTITPGCRLRMGARVMTYESHHKH